MTDSLVRPVRRIEVYGDSVSAGEVSEATAYAGKADPCTAESTLTVGIHMAG